MFCNYDYVIFIMHFSITNSLLSFKLINCFLNRYRREKSSRSDIKDKNDKYAHSDYSSRTDDARKNYDHKRDFKRNVGIFYLLLLFILIF